MAGSKYYGQFGGQYVSESLMNTLAELEKAFDEAIRDPELSAGICRKSNTTLLCRKNQ